MDFYKDIAHQLYIQNTKINGTYFSNPFDFIEAKHQLAEFKGKVFYENLIHAMPTGERFADIENGESPTFRENVFRTTLEYCKQKINGIDHPESEIVKAKHYVLYNYEKMRDMFWNAIKPYYMDNFTREYLLSNDFKEETAISEEIEYFIQFSEVFKLAGVEIDELVYSNNNNASGLISKLIKDYVKCDNDYKEFKEKYNSLSQEDKPNLLKYKTADLFLQTFYERYIEVFKQNGFDNSLGLQQNSKVNDKLTHKQQILLLNQLGFFELPFYNNLSTIKKGKLVSNLLNRTEKDSLEIVRGLNGKPDEKYKTNTPSNRETVNKLLKDLGLVECLVK